MGSALATFVGLVFLGAGVVCGFLAWIRYSDLKRCNPWEIEND